LRLLEIEHHAALAAIGAQEGSGHAALAGWPG
jgi:hypothetical protein